MGCDIANHPERPPYCKPKCNEFKLVVWLQAVKAQCIKCELLHEFTVADGQIRITQKQP